MSENAPVQPAAGFKALEQADRAERARNTDDAAVRRSLNALAVHSEMIGALLEYPGPNADPAAMVAAARQMIQSADNATEGLLSSLGISVKDMPWAHYRALRTVSKVVSGRWRQSARDGEVTAEVEDQLTAWQEIMRHPVPEPVYEAQTDDDLVSLRLGLLDATSRLVEEINVFDFFRPRNESLRGATGIIMNAAIQGARDLTGDAVSPHSVRQMTLSLLRNAGRIYASAWNRHAKDTVHKLQSRPRDEINKYVHAHPNGLPIDEIQAAFDDTFQKLLETVHFLVPPRREPAATDSAGSKPEDHPMEGAVESHDNVSVSTAKEGVEA